MRDLLHRPNILEPRMNDNISNVSVLLTLNTVPQISTENFRSSLRES